MRLLISFAALFLSTILLQLSSGGVGPLDALTGLEYNFTVIQVGLLGSSHFFGFFIGCWWAPRLMGNVGPSRTFAIFAAMGAIGLLSHSLLITPWAWSIMRIATGLCVAGCYTIIEAWLQSKVTNKTRGRTMGVYRIVDISGSLVAQTMIGFLANVELYVAYNTLTLLCCASLLPLAMTTMKPPETPSVLRLHPLLALERSPLAVSGVVVAGLSTAAYRMVGPVYGIEVGLDASQIGWFLAAFVASGAVAQYPAGWLADRYDRRWVLIGLSVGSVFSCILSLLVTGVLGIMIASAIFGLITFPIYSLAAAHAHDFATSDERVELSAALLFYYAVGAIASPLVVSWLIATFGSFSFFYFIAAGHLALGTFGLWRMTVGRTVRRRTPYLYIPRTSFAIGRLMKRLRDGE